MHNMNTIMVKSCGKPSRFKALSELMHSSKCFLMAVVCTSNNLRSVRVTNFLWYLFVLLQNCVLYFKFKQMRYARHKFCNTGVILAQICPSDKQFQYTNKIYSLKSNLVLHIWLKFQTISNTHKIYIFCAGFKKPDNSIKLLYKVQAHIEESIPAHSDMKANKMYLFSFRSWSNCIPSRSPATLQLHKAPFYSQAPDTMHLYFSISIILNIQYMCLMKGCI
uniref:Uncharacterized protein n=1 Tax=Sphaerodactylus townsendi TaxID=933632 RepID=A0ACB8FJ17_9SAUR